MSELTEKDWLQELKTYCSSSGQSVASVGVVIECRLPFPISLMDDGQVEGVQSYVEDVLETARRYGTAEIVDVVQLKPNEG